MTVKELNRDRLIQLKQNYYCSNHESVSYAELADVDNLVSDDEIYREYAGVFFVPEDFDVDETINKFCERGNDENYHAS